MAVIYLDGRALHYCVQGAGHDILFIHGWASSLRMWERSAAHLALAGWRAWALDLPGSGQSDALGLLNGQYAIANLARIVEAFAERVGVARAALVGHSMGGAIALEMAGRRPGAVSALVLVAPVVSGQFGLGMRVFLGSAFGRRLLGLAQRHGALARLGGRSRFALPWLVPNSALRRDAEDLVRAAPQAALGSLHAVLDFDFADRLSQLDLPTLVVVGSRDIVVPPGEGELAAARIPGARLVKMRGVGHQPVDEHPEEFDRLLAEFLKR